MVFAAPAHEILGCPSRFEANGLVHIATCCMVPKNLCQTLGRSGKMRVDKNVYDLLLAICGVRIYKATDPIRAVAFFV